jgi:hypothetical protein
MSLQDQIKSATGAHGLWKARLKSAIEKGSSEFSPGTVRLENQCEFGKWLHSVSDPGIKTSAGYHKCLDLHRQFHEAAAKVLNLALTGQKDAARQAMGLTSDFAKVSGTLTMAMNDWSHSAPK